MWRTILHSLAIACLLVVGACASSDERPLTPYEQAELKKQLIKENRDDLTSAQVGILLKSPFRTEAEANALVDRFLETNDQRTILDKAMMREKNAGATQSTPGTDAVVTPNAD